jgi:hypothetical protein
MPDMKVSTIAIGVLLVAFLVLALFFFGLIHWPYSTSNYRIGDEIKGFPVDELSITVLNWSTTTTVKRMGPPGLDSEYVVIPVIVHNLANHTLYFNRNDDFNDELTRAMSKQLFLVYGEKNYEVTSGFSSFTSWGSLSVGWGLNQANPAEASSLAANQSATGFLCFDMSSYYTPKELVCSNGPNTQPIFIVDLNKQ